MRDSTHDLQTPADIVLYAVNSDLERHTATTAHEISYLTALPLEQVRAELDTLVAAGTLSSRAFTLVNESWFHRDAGSDCLTGLTLYTLVKR